MPATAFESAVYKHGILPAGNRTNGTVNGTGVDLNGADTVAVAINSGTITDGSHAFSIEESDVIGSGYTAIPAARLTSTFPTLTSANNNQVAMRGAILTKQFARVVVVTSGATTGGIFSAGFIVTDNNGGLPIT